MHDGDADIIGTPQFINELVLRTCCSAERGALLLAQWLEHWDGRAMRILFHLKINLKGVKLMDKDRLRIVPIFESREELEYIVTHFCCNRRIFAVKPWLNLIYARWKSLSRLSKLWGVDSFKKKVLLCFEHHDDE